MIMLIEIIIEFYVVFTVRVLKFLYIEYQLIMEMATDLFEENQMVVLHQEGSDYTLLRFRYSRINSYGNSRGMG